MSQKSPLFLAVSLLITIAIAAAMIACGGGSSTPKNLTQAQAQAIASAVSSGIAQSTAGGFGVSAASTPAHRMRGETTPEITGFPCAPGGICTAEFNSTFDCPGGGTMAIAGTILGTLDDSGDGSVVGQLVAAPMNCSVDSLVLNGDPSVNVATTVNIKADQPQSPIIGAETGGITYGPNPSGSCKFNVTYTVNFSNSNLSCTASGTACGYSVSGSC